MRPRFTLHSLLLGTLALAFVLPWVPAAEDPGAPGLIATLKGHGEAVYAVGFSPDGKYVVSGSGDKMLKIWDGATGKELKSYGGPTGHQSLVLSVSLNREGTLIATGGSDNTAKLWDFPGSSPIRALAKSEGAKTLAVSNDGAKLAGGDKDGTIKIWNSADGKELLKFQGHRGIVTGLAFGGNGQILVSSGADKTVRFWNPANGQSLGVVGAHASEARGVAFNPNGSAVYSVGADGLLKFWPLPPVASKPVGSPHGDAVSALALSPDGNTLVSASADKTVRVANAGSGQLVRELKGANAAVESAALSPNGAIVAAGTADKHLLVWQTKDGQLLADVANLTAGLAFHPTSNQLITGGSDGALKLWAMPPTPERILAHADAVRAAVASADGKRLFTGGADKIVRSWNLADTKQPERQFSGHTAAVNAVSISGNGQLLASTGDDGTVRFWNQSNGQSTVWLGVHEAPATSLAFDGSNRVLSASADGSIKLWQPPTNMGKLLAHPAPVVSAMLSSDGTRLLTGCGDKQVRLWNSTSGKLERPFTGHALGVLCVAMNPSGTQVAGGGADKTLLLWETANAKEIKRFVLPAAVISLAFAPDGKKLAVGLADNSIHLFDPTMGKEIKTITGHMGPVNSLVFTAKGDRLISASADKSIQVWSLAEGKSEKKLDYGGSVSTVALSKDEARIAAGGANKTVEVWTLADGKSQVKFATPASVHGVCFSPDGSRLLVANDDNKARLYGLDGKLVEFFGHDGPVHAVAFHNDGKSVFTASADKTARSWPLSLAWQARHDGPVRQAIFNARFDRVVSCGDDKTVKIWNAADGKLVKSLVAHDAPVVGVAVNADATRIVSCGADKTVKVFTLAAKADAKADNPVTVNLPAPASAVALSPNGRYLAVAVEEKSRARVLVLDAATGKELLVYADRTGAILSLSFLADNRTLISAGTDKVVRLSDMNLISTFDASSGGVASVAISSNGSQVLSGGADKTVKLWDAAKGQIVKTFGPLPEAVRAVSFNRAGTQIGAVAGKLATVWNLADGKEVRKLDHPDDVLSLSFSADGTRLSTGGSDKEVHVWELTTGRELQAFPQEGAVRSAVFHPSNNALLFSAGTEKSVNRHTTTIARVVPVGTPLHALNVASNGAHVLTAGDDGKIKLWNTGNGNNERTFDAGDKAIHALTVSKSNILLASGGVDRIVRVFSFNDGKLLAEIKAPGAIRGLTFAPDGRTLAAACAPAQGAGILQTWNVVYNSGQPTPAEFGKPIQGYGEAGAVGDLVFDPKGDLVYSGSGDKAIQVWKFASDAPTKSFQHPNLVDVVAFSPDGTQLATGCHDGRVRLFDVAKGTVIREIQAHVTVPQPSAVYCLAWSADGKQIVSGSFDRTLKLWNVADGKLIREFKAYEDKKFEKGHRDSVVSLALSPDGKMLASGDWDHSIKIWNVADGSVVRDLINPTLKPRPDSPQAHPGVVYALRFTPDGKRLVSAGGAPRLHGYLAIWNVADGKLLHGSEQAWGTLFSLALSADGKYLAVGTGGSNTPGEEGNKNNAYVMKLPPNEQK